VEIIGLAPIHKSRALMSLYPQSGNRYTCLSKVTNPSLLPLRSEELY